MKDFNKFKLDSSYLSNIKTITNEVSFSINTSKINSKSTEVNNTIMNKVGSSPESSSNLYVRKKLNKKTKETDVNMSNDNSNSITISNFVSTGRTNSSSNIETGKECKCISDAKWRS